MTSSAKKVPKLRFPGFSDEWKKKKLDDITVVNPKSSNLPDKFYYIDLESVKNGVLLKQSMILKIKAPSRAQRLLEKDDIIYQTVRPYQKNNYFFNLDGTYVASTGYAQIRTAKEHHSRFIYMILHTNDFVNKVLVRATGTNYPAINSKDLAKISITLPAKPEQEKIANFLFAIDEKIYLLNKKKEQLEKYKKGVMQQIFTQKIRFKDENGQDYPDWQKKSLGAIFDERMEKGGTLQNMLSITIKNGIVPFSKTERKDNSSSDKSNYKQVKVGDIAYNSMRMWQGASGVSKYDGIVSPAYTVVCPKEGNVSDFWGYYFKLPSVIFTFQRHSQGLTSDTWNLKFEQLIEIELLQPVEEEQNLIADLLSIFDEKILAEERKLESAKAFKKSLIQQMFA